MYIGAAPPNRAARVAARQARVASRGAVQQARAEARGAAQQARAAARAVQDAARIEARAANVAERLARQQEQRQARALRTTVTNAPRGEEAGQARALARSRPHPTLRMERAELPHISPQEAREMRMLVRPQRQGSAPRMERITDDLPVRAVTLPASPRLIPDPGLIEPAEIFPPMHNDERRDLAFASFRPTGVRALPKHKYAAPSQIQHSVPSQNVPTPQPFLDDRSDMKWMRRAQTPTNRRVSIGTILDDFGNFNVADYFDE